MGLSTGCGCALAAFCRLPLGTARRRASVGSTNVANLRRNILLLCELRLIVGGSSDKHADIKQATFGVEASRSRFYEFLLNCANFEKKTIILDVSP
jgi:hypothetical protein